ncbi:MAG TPA: 1-phosphofructokinase [Firmicutes bacterium]|nr:1-phosphofructokinase [Bacillota bacterium]
MIYTVTFNPAIDYVMKLDSLKIGEVNRSVGEEIYVGGKGINVSIVLNELGVKSRALGFCAGFTGAAIEKGIKSMGIETDFVHLESGNSRINVKIRAEDETELNGQGPQISREAIISLLERLDMMKEGDTLVLAGSIPNTLPENIYELILERLSGKKIRFVVDATKDLLLNVLKFKPFLIKPNNFELGEMFNTTLKTNDEIISCAKELQSRGAENVLVSMAGDGAILADAGGEVHIIGTPEGKAVNSVGAGDSMVAGFIAGYMESGDYAYALRLGTAAGSATAFSMGLAKSDEIYRLLQIIQSGK